MKSINYIIINKQNKLRVRKDLFEKIETEEDAYWLGFIYADGYISDEGTFELSLKHTDYNHLLKFADYCGFDRSKVVRKQKTNFPNSFRCRIGFATQQLQFNFNKHGIIPRKSLTLEFPKFLNKSLYSSFIRGYFDGDGCISLYYGVKGNISRKAVSLIGTEKFLNSILNVIKIKRNLGKDKRWSDNTYCISFTKQQGFNFLNYIYKNSKIHLERKYQLYLQ